MCVEYNDSLEERRKYKRWQEGWSSSHNTPHSATLQTTLTLLGRDYGGSGGDPTGGSLTLSLPPAPRRRHKIREPKLPPAAPIGRQEAPIDR